MFVNFSDAKKKIEKESSKNIDRLHQFSKKLWQRKKFTPYELQNKCFECWDELKDKFGSRIRPLIPIKPDHPITNLIFGSGSFSTGEFQVAQYKKVESYLDTPPIILQGIVTNKSKDRGCNGEIVAQKYNIPYISLDFTDWYHNHIDEKESNPIRATRYWFQPHDPNKPIPNEIGSRFNIRQNKFHKALGEQIEEKLKLPTDIVSARGYNFQFCQNIFTLHQAYLPAINDTHPTDLTFVDPNTNERLYPGWQSGAVELMLHDKLNHIRGSLIGIDYMDKVEQINELDEGPILAIGQGMEMNSYLKYNPSQIQELIKIMDDYFFCTLEPTGLILAWGISEEKIPITYQNISGDPLILKQRAIFVGNKKLSGISAFGSNLIQNLYDLEQFLLS